MKRKVKQGQTWWMLIPSDCVNHCFIYRCFITKVINGQIYYDIISCDKSLDHYTQWHKSFKRDKIYSFKKAISKAKLKVNFYNIVNNIF